MRLARASADSDIVKRKRIRIDAPDRMVKRSVLDPNDQARSCITSNVDVCLTATFPDAFEAKLVFHIDVSFAFSNEWRSRVHLPRAGWASIMRAIKCLKGIRWMPWR